MKRFLNAGERYAFSILKNILFVADILFNPIGKRAGMITILMVLSIPAVQASETTSANPTQPNGLLAISPINQLPSEQFQNTLSGTIIDQAGNPVAGASVRIQNSHTQSMTDAKGQFSIRSVLPSGILQISYVGYQTTEQPFDAAHSGPYRIVLSATDQALEEVAINAGYYTVTDRERTGSISRITSEEISRQPVTNPMAAMIGRMPGVHITQQTGMPGGAFKIQIRGQNSLRSDGNDPLYIVDGVPFTAHLGSAIGNSVLTSVSPLNALNPADIESIEVLKDADATAIYGSRGANGAVLISTHRGQDVGLKIELNSYHGFGKVSNQMDLLNTQQYLQMRHEAFTNDGIMPGAADYDVNGVWNPDRFTDWQQKLIGQTARLSNIKLTVSGGNLKTRFLFGSGYTRETTVTPGNFSDGKVNANFSLNHGAADDRLKISLSGNYVVDQNNLMRIDPTSTALTLAPNAPAIYTADNELNWENGTWHNPMARFEQSYSGKIRSLSSNALLSYRLFESLAVKATMGYSNIDMDEHSTQPKSSFSPDEFIASSASFGQSEVETWIIEPQVEYTEQLGGGTLSVLVGLTFQHTSTNNQLLTASGFANDALMNNPQAASNLNMSSANSTIYRYNALFGRVNYSWQNKYFLNLTGRRDGSSRFGPGKQFANFGALGGAWVFADERLVREYFPFVSFGKVRASFGITGSDQIGDYGFYDNWNTTQYTYGGVTTLVPGNLFNPDFAWEENRKMEVAIDIGLWADRLRLSGSYYDNRSGNQLVGLQLPTATGFYSVQANFPARVQNRGWELEMQSANINSKGFKWNTAMNLTIPRNRLLAYPEIEKSAYQYTYEIGRPLGVQFDYHYTGVDPLSGVHTYVDRNGDGLYSQADYFTRKELSQQYFGGMNNLFSFKGFRLDVFLQMVKQTGYAYFGLFPTAPGRLSNQPVEVLDRWQQGGDQTDIQRFTATTGVANTAYSMGGDRRIADASFIRLKNVSFSYDLPDTWTARYACRMYMMGQNLWTLTGYKGLDPEMQSNRLPPIRMITAGVQLTF